MCSDGIPREGDVCTYTSVLYLASLAALEKLAVAYGNQTLAARCRTSKAKALAAVERLLWTGTHFRGFACDGRGVADSNIQGADRELARTLLSGLALRTHSLAQATRSTVSSGRQSSAWTRASHQHSCGPTWPSSEPGQRRRMG